MTLYEALTSWRTREAHTRGVPAYRIVTNESLEAIANAAPRTLDELGKLKGIGDMKCVQFGDDILQITKRYIDNPINTAPILDIESAPTYEPKAMSVAAFLTRINATLHAVQTSVIGEITSIKEQGNALYISIKDETEPAVMSVFIWKSDYLYSKNTVAVGDTVIMEGYADIYKPTGRMSFRAIRITRNGDGIFKQTYDALCKKLKEEGLFDTEKKRLIPAFPEKIGVITSREGAVIHDFRNNLGKYGFKIVLKDARVEGEQAIASIASAIDSMQNIDIDCLVIIRGGGSLESLQAFNSEIVARKIAHFPKPVICAIGHDTDVPITQLVADYAPSTPTAAAVLLNQKWQQLEEILHTEASTLALRGKGYIEQIRSHLTEDERDLMRFFGHITGQCGELFNAIQTHAARMSEIFSSYTSTLSTMDKILNSYNPLTRLKLGYSITKNAKGSIVRSINDVNMNEEIEIQVSDGIIHAQTL